MNTQPKSKVIHSDGKALKVHSIFYTLQGEGVFSGMPAVFVRLEGCNLQCPNCDTEYTGGSEMSLLKIMQKIRSVVPETLQGKITEKVMIVLTGGEPMRQPIEALCTMLHDSGYAILIETNGTVYRDLPPHTMIACSPKTGAIAKELIPSISYYKYVLRADNVDPEDGLPIHALDHPCKPKLFRPPKDSEAVIYLTPEDTGKPLQDQVHVQACVKSCLKFGHCLNLQIHKLVGVE
jgi:organic radical activating enzyme